MALVSELQMFQAEDITPYDEDEAYKFIFVTRGQIASIARDGMLPVTGYIEAVDDATEWSCYNRRKIREEERAFILICQVSKLIEAGFIEPIVVSEKPKDWKEKIDDGFDELRVDHNVYFEPIGYCLVFKFKKKTSTRWEL